MRVSSLRWIAVPFALVGSYYLAFFLFLKIELSCLAIGSRPDSLCSNWWYENHSWVGAVIFGLALVPGAVLLPTLLAPRFKGIVGVLVLAAVVTHTVSEFDLWAWRVAVPIVVVSAAVLGAIFRNRLFRGDHAARQITRPHANKEMK